MIIVVLVGLNWDYFLPRQGKMGELTGEEIFTDTVWDSQRKAAIYDYLPLAAKTAPKTPMIELVEAIEGEIVVTDKNQGTDWARANIEVLSDVAVLRLGIFQFPGWKTFVNGELVENYVPESEKWGRMNIDIPKGKHVIDVVFTNTQVRTISNTISFITWLGLGVFVLYSYRRHRHV